MDARINVFNEVTLLITHFNRSHSLERLLKAFENLNCVFGGIVVSDDCSEELHLNQLHKLSEKHNFKLVTTPKNGGLGNNINKGQDAITTDYTLYIQEDFIPKQAFVNHFRNALTIMKEDQLWDLITFYSYFPYPYMVPYKMGFSEKTFHTNPLYMNHLKFYLYGDHPHLRRTTFLDKFGRYPEGLNGDKTEMEMSLSFIRKKGKALFYNDHYELLEQANSTIEPSTASFRKSWTQSKSPFVLFIRWFYLKYKFTKLTLKLFAK
jgi:glycosyltransferase involved in cell wall biosynthesis